jgi:hypothetical protein
MDKDITILKLLDQLDILMHKYSIRYIDLWEVDLCAIGLVKGDRLMYISTYNYVNNAEIRYDIEVEIINDQGERVLTRKVMKNISTDALINEIIYQFEA